MALDKYPRVCFSAGHGLGSRVEEKTDPGANVVGYDWDEDDFNLRISKRLYADFAVLFRGTHGRVMLRNSGKFSKADDDAAAWGADLFIESHLNAGGGTGTEVLFESPYDKKIAVAASAAIAGALVVRNRGAKRVTNIDVLEPRKGMKQILVEWFFADSKKDLAQWSDNRFKAELAMVNVILTYYGWKPVKSLPRKWSKARRLLYKPY